MNRLSSLTYPPSFTSKIPHGEPESGNEQSDLTISQMSRLYGVSLRTLRFYEDRGLIKPRREGNARYYRDAERTQMDMILRGKKLGFTLSEISDLIGGRGGSETSDIERRLRPQQVLAQLGHLERQRREIDDAIARLRAAQDRLADNAA